MIGKKNRIIFFSISAIIFLTAVYFIAINPIFEKKRDFNIIFISIDTLRADHLGSYGYHRDTSPNIDAFAEKNILFTNFFTVVPKTGPAMTSFFTGKLMQNHGVVSNDIKRDPSITTLAQLLPENYKKAAFGANVSLTAERGYSDGFDEYTIVKGSRKDLTSKATDWLTQNSLNSKFFLWLHYLDPHGPYRPPPEFHEMYVGDRHYDSSKKVALKYRPHKGYNANFVFGAVPRYQRLGDIDEVDYYIAQYDAEIRYIDNEIKKLLDFLELKKLTKNTIIIITSDHGESLGENNYYFEHGLLVNEGSIRIPLIIHHPEIKKPLVINALLQNTDLAPTLLDEFGLQFSTEIDGISFSQLIHKRKTDYQLRSYIYACTPHVFIDFYETIRTETDKLIRKNEKVYSYFDKTNDKLETNDLFSKMNKDLLKEKTGIINGFGKDFIKSGSKVDFPKDKLNELKSLGYVN